jgi:hypothetical protein
MGHVPAFLTRDRPPPLQEKQPPFSAHCQQERRCGLPFDSLPVPAKTLAKPYRWVRFPVMQCDLQWVIHPLIGPQARHRNHSVVDFASIPQVLTCLVGCLVPILPTGCATRLKGENVAPYSPGLASPHSIERRPLSTAQGCKDVTGSIIQRAKCHNARIHVAADRNTNMLKLYRQPFFRRRIFPQKQL